MKTQSSLAVAALALALVAGSLQAQTVQEKVEAGKGKVEVAQLVELNGTITALDVATRDVTLKTDKGEEISFVAGPDVQRLADIKVGDRVEIQYYESLTLKLSKVEGGTPATSETATEMRAEPTELPGGIKSQSTTITAKITAVDATAGTVTLVGPEGPLGDARRRSGHPRQGQGRRSRQRDLHPGRRGLRLARREEVVPELALPTERGQGAGELDDEPATKRLASLLLFLALDGGAARRAGGGSASGAPGGRGPDGAGHHRRRRALPGPRRDGSARRAPRAGDRRPHRAARGRRQRRTREPGRRRVPAQYRDPAPGGCASSRSPTRTPSVEGLRRELLANVFLQRIQEAIRAYREARTQRQADARPAAGARRAGGLRRLGAPRALDLPPGYGRDRASLPRARAGAGDRLVRVRPRRPAMELPAPGAPRIAARGPAGAGLPLPRLRAAAVSVDARHRRAARRLDDRSRAGDRARPRSASCRICSSSIVLYIFTRWALNLIRLFFDGVGERRGGARGVRPGLGGAHLQAGAHGGGRVRPRRRLSVHPGVGIARLQGHLALHRAGLLARLLVGDLEHHRRLHHDLPPALSRGRPGADRRRRRNGARTSGCR